MVPKGCGLSFVELDPPLTGGCAFPNSVAMGWYVCLRLCLAVVVAWSVHWWWLDPGPPSFRNTFCFGGNAFLLEENSFLFEHFGKFEFSSGEYQGRFKGD